VFGYMVLVFVLLVVDCESAAATRL
jgi:hypothetical protein